MGRNKIDWTAYTYAAKTSPISNIQLVKLVHDKLPTKYKLAKANPHTSPTCLYCSHNETFLHLLACHNHISQKFCEELRTQLELYFFSTGTPDNLRDTNLTTMPNWLHEHGIQASPMDPNSVTTSQQNIGWHLLPRGFLTLQWRAQFNKARKSNTVLTHRGPTEYIAGIIHIIWNAQLQLWTTYQKEISKQNKVNSPRAQGHRQEYSSRFLSLTRERTSACTPTEHNTSIAMWNHFSQRQPARKCGSISDITSLQCNKVSRRQDTFHFDPFSHFLASPESRPPKPVHNPPGRVPHNQPPASRCYSTPNSSRGHFSTQTYTLQN